MWSSDGTRIGFSAYTSRTPRRSPCSGLVNSEIFLIAADGSTTASQITNTSGTSVEAWPKWGWKPRSGQTSVER
jgi:Tol biopolymer transport system component